MGGRIGFTYRSTTGEVTSWVRWTNTMRWFFLDVRLGTDPDAVMAPALAQLTDRQQGDELGSPGVKLPAVSPQGYGLVVIDALPLATGGKVRVTDMQGYCDTEDVTTTMPFELGEDPDTEAFLDALFVKFPPVVSGWIPTRLVTEDQEVFASNGPRELNGELIEAESCVDLSEVFGSPKNVADLMKIDRYGHKTNLHGVFIEKYPGVNLFPLRFYVKDRDVEFRPMPQNAEGLAELRGVLSAEGFVLDVAEWDEWARKESE